MVRLAGMVLELAKVRIALLATASAVTGYFLAARGLGADVVPLVAGVFLLAGGAGALNQVQEVDIDALMKRTAGRPIPSGRMSRRAGLAVALALLAGGLALLASNAAAAMLGACTVIWYNGIYTPLKRISAFAAIPGGVVGALPPAIGWVAGGGSVADPRIAAVAFFFFVWQVPHFWLLLLRIGDDYARAGLPTLTRLFSRRQLSRIIYVWMIATAVACLSMPLFGVSSAVWAQAGLALASLWLGWHATTMVRSDGAVLAFHQINLYALFVISVLSLSGLVG
ncbi:MAG TPA: protoheme IX farnesyltransferase [Candidatus Krumholzibacteria bacterium]|nr:protoheme IX farnesyltransferase [Candidatus Krumholzibacteria bacterium]